jgi:PAS domain S-box-containing protein
MLDVVVRDGKWEGTITRQRKNGEQFTARVVVTSRLDRAGVTVGFLFISKDISGEIRMTEELEAAQSYTRSLVESNIDALITTDPLGVITDVNQQMETLTDRGREALVGTPLKDYFTEPDRVEDCIRLVLRESKVTDYELTARRPDNSTTVVSYNASTFCDSDAKLLGVFASARDVTERKRSEEELKQKNGELERANLAKDRFLASMSHELRTPLNAVIGFTGTMLMGLPGPLTDDQALQLKAIQRGGRHLLSLINDLLDLAKIEAGKLELTLEPVSCKSVIDEVAESLRPLSEEKHLTLGVDMLAPDVVVLADRRALSQILLNLVNNAIKFTKEGGVTIELPHPIPGGRVEVRVRDTGIGIDDNGRNRLFEAFEQLTPGDDRLAGTGLGLHVSSKLATLLDATIVCDSEVGVGSTFTVSLKAA